MYKKKVALSEQAKEAIRREPKTTLKAMAHKYNVAISTICKIRLYNEAMK